MFCVSENFQTLLKSKNAAKKLFTGTLTYSKNHIKKIYVFPCTKK